MHKKIAYLILAHTDPTQLERLINALNYNCDFFIHIDLYADIKPFRKISLPNNATTIAERVPVNWAGFSQVQASMNLIHAALNTGEDYSHLLLLSGMDYPIKPPVQISHYLNENQDKQFIKIDNMEDKPEWYLPMLKRYFFRDTFPFISNRQARRVIRFGLEEIARPFKRKFLPGLKPFAGSSWWAITLDCANFIIDYTKRNPHVIKFYKKSFASDEQFYHTVIGNSKFASQIKFQEKNDRIGVHEFANLHIVHASLQKIYNKEDFEEIAKSDKFFVRKVNTQASKDLLDMIDSKLLNNSNFR